ncbi:MAG TPA: YdeI/OmpD-associated family protein [Solirubrobacterales bacterium]
MPEELPVILFSSAAELEVWLEREHDRSPGIWLKIAKRGSGIDSVSYADAVELGLCFGWIDGQGRRLDERHYLQRFTPRRAQSRWSRLNRDRVEELAAAGRMRPAGIAAVDAAKADGRWDAAYEPPSSAEVPADLERELERDRAARRSFEALDGANRYAIIYRLNDARRPETRERRLRKFLEMLRRGEKIHP